ncbi:hypothetical protein GCM10028805_15190 [Spirosoma harenae]
MYSLIFFIAYLFGSCQSSDTTDLSIRWNDKRATGITIPNRLIESVPDDSLNQLVTVRLADQETPIAGQLQRTDNAVIFEPLVSFTRGLQYTVWLRNKPLGEIAIPTLESSDKPTLLAIYPSPDSLPDNLLKMYLHFSRPMREGQSLKYVTLLKNQTDTLPGVFLDLQPELWNADRTILTLWLDPGRIKRDLQPNQQLGAPLVAGASYKLVIDGNWPDQQGASLGKSTEKVFRTIRRDSLSPNTDRWSVHSPKSGSTESLAVNFGESLDYYLLTETLYILQRDGKLVAGSWKIGKNEKQSQFVPDMAWQSGQYKLRIESRLEDLAGNNLNRPFDRDITKEMQSSNQPFRELTFVVK